ncbi:tRNA uridine-5-carboxymethylaminomethyl(34) synthesis GTPase MnmE [Effusibacillus dendaii]|uniref:tRNA modification GTPase MnmE n=1 Tax=Effusibacillus dendaii TaxID=2743772 RepID=A0A7I8DBV9_9BACL|nr:tRNA uridine-5-carboxymethylaminomethyl(34) synthesis GTPase MnmE [Effusibacillus dendaii]BCJ87477.1 tRNA modification GTPase MnmE [Effusibacillus dendaii]
MLEFDTIAAIATALGEGSIGVIRISGPDAIKVADTVFHSRQKLADAASHTLHYGYITVPETGEKVDEVLVSLMRSPRSFTREDVVEISCHGGIIVIQRVLQLVLGAGARLAEPGEFTKRAFLNGRIDLSQAEAIIDLIRSKTDSSMKIAFRQVEGFLRKKIASLRQTMIELMAHIEVTIDYPEHDVEDVAIRQIIRQGNEMRNEIRSLLQGSRTGRIYREGIRTVIIGKPNVGKSSLLNLLSRTDRAIVTDIPGTTRDILEEQISIRGIPIQIIDTAGIRETEDVVERIGVERSRGALEEADLILFMLDASRPLDDTDRELLTYTANKPTVIILNKLDLPRRMNLDEIRHIASSGIFVEMSVKETSGLEKLEQQVESLFLSGSIEGKEAAYVSNVRHISLLEKADRQLKDAIESAEAGMTLDLVAVDIREAWETLGEIIGETAGEDLLDQIFSQFCLGK